MNAVLILAIIEAVLKYGPSAVIAISEVMKKDNPTPEEIRILFIDKTPEEYF